MSNGTKINIIEKYEPNFFEEENMRFSKECPKGDMCSDYVPGRCDNPAYLCTKLINEGFVQDKLIEEESIQGGNC